MAEIQKRTETTVRSFYRLDLSQEEAEVLYVVLGKVGGLNSGYRSATQHIYDELKKSVGYETYKLDAYDHITGTLHFDAER